MFWFKEPSQIQVRKFLSRQELLNPTFYPSGLSLNGSVPQSGFHEDNVVVRLGVGARVFRTARKMLLEWQHFKIGWVSLFPRIPAMEPGTTIAICAKIFPRSPLVWSLNGCRIIYVINERDQHGMRFGYGYATLPDHAECGESRFLLEWNFESDQVTFSIFAFSRAGSLLSLLLWPIGIWVQDRFRRDSARAFAGAVGSAVSAQLDNKKQSRRANFR